MNVYLLTPDLGFIRLSMEQCSIGKYSIYASPYFFFSLSEVGNALDT